MSQKQPRTASSSLHVHVIFVHLDLGIGGAEQLVLQLAESSIACGHSIELVTTNCQPTHCFASVKPPNGPLYPFLRIHGNWIPQDIAGKFRTLCSTLRLLYLTYWLARRPTAFKNTLIVLDVLPTPLPFLSYLAPTLFYCHFPDLLLKRDANQTTTPSSSSPSLAKSWYRTVLNGLEEHTMSYGDVLVVNSLFTKSVVQQTFPKLQDLHVLYPALKPNDDNNNTKNKDSIDRQYMIVSLNRYERKKNLELVLYAVDWMRSQKDGKQIALPHIVIAGGYDRTNVENVEYRAELQHLADTLSLKVDFRQSISDEERATLLSTCAAVLYTPANEHFGIVPLEAMQAGTPVIALNSGGPKETILSGKTGFLCDNTAASVGQAVKQILQDFPDLSNRLGQAGKEHVLTTFGADRMVQEWQRLTQLALQRGHERQRNTKYQVVSLRNMILLLETFVVFVLVLCLTALLRCTGLLGHDESIAGSIKRLTGLQPTGEL